MRTNAKIARTKKRGRRLGRACGQHLFEPLENRLLYSVTMSPDGWTDVTPSGDSRVIYVSSSGGNDANSGLSPSLPVKTLAKGISLMRSGMPDEMLLKRGDTWNESLGSWKKSGRSADEPAVVSTYGTGDRPLLLTGTGGAVWTANDPVANIVFSGLHFKATASSDQFAVSWMSGTDNLLFEDMRIDGPYYGGITLQSIFGPVTDVAVRRSVITDMKTQGLYSNGLDGILLEENVFDHNGWNDEVGDDPSVLDHNVYMSSKNENVTVRGNVFARASSHGLQARAGGTIVNNLFIDNPIGMSFGYVNGATIKAGGVSGLVAGNVFIGGRDILGSARGWAIEVGNTKAGGGTTIRDNIILQDNQMANSAIQVSYGSGVTNAAEAVGINDLTIESNIVYGWHSAVRLKYGLVPGGTGATALNGLVVRDNEFAVPLSDRFVDHGPAMSGQELWEGNKYSSSSDPSAWFRFGNATTTSWAQWKATVEPDASTYTPSYPDPTRSMATYAANLGLGGTVEAFLNAARLQQRGAYELSYGAVAAINYVRAGFGISPSAVTTGTGTGVEGTPYTLNLGVTHQGTETISGWTVDWGDGTIQHVDGSPDSLTHTYADDGTYSVSAGATGLAGLYVAGAHQVVVTNADPVLNISVGQASAKYLYRLNFGSTDHGLDTVTGWTIDWGDGTTETVNAASGSVTHTFLPGTYEVVATATDEDGSYDAGEWTLNVARTPVENVTGLDYDVVEGGAVMLSPNWSHSVGVTYEWDLDGDGIFGETGANALYGDEVGANAIFNAAGLVGPGSVSIAVRARDEFEVVAAGVGVVTVSGVPNSPDGPELPGGPNEPSGPELPGDPNEPSGPQLPDDPNQPGGPQQPNSPDEPEVPGDPGDDEHQEPDPVVTIPKTSTSAGTSDFNGDGLPDRVWFDKASRSVIVTLRHDGDATNVQIPKLADQDAMPVLVADLDGNGTPDILWKSSADRRNDIYTIWLLGEDLETVTVKTVAKVSKKWSVAGTGDFNDDQKSDIVWRTNARGAQVVWLMNGNWKLRQMALKATGAQWSYAGASDFNNDGRIDVVLASTKYDKFRVMLTQPKGKQKTVNLKHAGGPLKPDADDNGFVVWLSNALSGLLVDFSKKLVRKISAK